MQEGLHRALINAAIIAALYLLLLAAKMPIWLGALLLALIAGFLVYMPQRSQPQAKENVSKLPLGKGISQFGDVLSTSFLFLNGSGRITYMNTAAHELFPQLLMGDHFSKLSRSPKFINALQGLMHSDNCANFTFNSHPSGEHILEVRINMLKPKLAEKTKAKWCVEFIDRTETRQNDAMRREFIANASHELRTPLTAILGAIETIAQAGSARETALDKFLPLMSREAERMQRLIEDLMSLSQLELNQHIRPNTPINIKTALDHALELIRPEAAKLDVKITVQIENTPQIGGDIDQIEQIFVNILDNALKYGGENGHIRIFQAEASPKRPRKFGISIADNGAGIARAHIGRLTERFYRASTDLSREKGGTGLGLAIVKHILRRHGGELEIDSVLGQGSVFTIWLPTI